jgi:hypothetical protein
MMSEYALIGLRGSDVPDSALLGHGHDKANVTYTGGTRSHSTILSLRILPSCPD